MAELDTMQERLKWARMRAAESNPEFKSQRSAADARGWNRNTYKGHEHRNDFSEEDAKKYGRAYKVNWLWLLHKAGEPHSKTSEVLESQDGDSSETDFGALVPVREMDLYAGAGGGGEMPATYRVQKDGSWRPTDAVKARVLFPREWITSLGLDAAFTDLVRVRGDSMSPEIEDGDWVFVDRRIHRLQADDIYLFWDGYEHVIKSLALVRSTSPPRVRVISANRKYPQDELPLVDVRIIGRVHYRIGRIVRPQA